MGKEDDTEKSVARKFLETGTKIGVIGIAFGLFVPGVIVAALALTAGTYIGSKMVK